MVRISGMMSSHGSKRTEKKEVPVLEAQRVLEEMETDKQISQEDVCKALCHVPSVSKTSDVCGET
jgi:ATP-dependent protease HslVU (ClpYQ) ATPase subunit